MHFYQHIFLRPDCLQCCKAAGKWRFQVTECNTSTIHAPVSLLLNPYSSLPHRMSGTPRLLFTLFPNHGKPVYLSTKLHPLWDNFVYTSGWVSIIYDVLKLRSTRCSDLCVSTARNRRQFAIHGSMTACLNIVFKHCWCHAEHQELLSSKHIYIMETQSWHIYTKIISSLIPIILYQKVAMIP